MCVDIQNNFSNFYDIMSSLSTVTALRYLPNSVLPTWHHSKASNEITTTKSLKMLQKCFLDSTLARTLIFEWPKTPNKGREVIKKIVNDGNIAKVKKIVFEKRRVGIREVPTGLSTTLMTRLNYFG